MIIALLKFFGYIDKDDKNLPQSDVSGSLPTEIEHKIIINRPFKYGDACRKCGAPAYNNRGKGVCYLCDTDIWD